MYTSGQIVKLKYKSTEYPLFVIVTDDKVDYIGRTTSVFSGTVLANYLFGVITEPYNMLKVGRHTNSWPETSFELASFDELKNWI